MMHDSYSQAVDRIADATPTGVTFTDVLPKETLYLPFAAGPYRWDMGLVPLQSGLFEVDALYPAQMMLRRELLERSSESVFAALPGSEPARRECLDLVTTQLSANHPAWFLRDGDRLHNRLTDETWDLAAPPHDPLALAGRLVQEDLCVLGPDEEGPILTAAVLCFPSGWRLADKIGRGIAEIHAPVPEFGDRLATPVGRVVRQLPAGRLLGRLNWALVDDPSLYRPDDRNYRADRNDAVTAQSAGESLFLRVERQILSRLPASGAVLFTIRVHVYPLAAAITSPATAGRLAAAVRALPGDMQHYKSLFPFREALLAWLDAAA